MFQRPAELMPGAVDVRLDCAQRQVEGGGNFFVRPALDVAEHDARSVLGSETLDRSLDRGAELASFDLLERGLLLADDIERGCFDRFSGLRVRRPVDADRIELTPPQ